MYNSDDDATPLDLAIEQGHGDVRQVLKRNGGVTLVRLVFLCFFSFFLFVLFCFFFFSFCLFLKSNVCFVLL